MRILEDCRSNNLEIIVTENINGFGSYGVEVLESLNKLREHRVRVIFEQEGLDTADTDSELMISIIESIAQAENKSRSEILSGESRLESLESNHPNLIYMTKSL